jgi:small-conductance mechanosensitive channel
MPADSEQSAAATPSESADMLVGLQAWMEGALLEPGAAWQALALLLIGAVTWTLSRLLRPLTQRLVQPPDGGEARFASVHALSVVPRLVTPLTAALGLWLAYSVFQVLDMRAEALRILANLFTAWVVIRLASGLVPQRGWSALIAATAWTVAALAILGWLGPILDQLDAATFRAGEFRLSALDVINAIGLLFIIILVATLAIRVIESRLSGLEGVTPAAQVLVGKVLRILLYIVATIVALTSVGVDLTAVAVFSGALGLGIGFGLQKVISNLFSGIILLLDRSLRPGDVIELGDAYGWIDKMGARYITVATRDGKEFLIPNEDLVTQQVVNWSFSNRAVRVRIKVGISYRSDVRKAMALIVQAAETQPRVLSDEAHEPQVRLVAFADSSVDLELRIWVTDPEQGLQNVSSEIRLQIWDLFHEQGVEFPFPQRDLHIASAPGLQGLLPGDRELGSS